MTYEHGKPISTLLSEFLLKNTSEKDVEDVRAKFDFQKSNSLVSKLRQGRYAVNADTEKYVDELFAIAVKNYNREYKRFEPLIKSKKAA